VLRTAETIPKTGISTRENSPQRTERSASPQREYSQKEVLASRQSNFKTNSKKDATKTKVHKTDPIKSYCTHAKTRNSKN
jgi:hypothetical protein